MKKADSVRLSDSLIPQVGDSVLERNEQLANVRSENMENSTTTTGDFELSGQGDCDEDDDPEPIQKRQHSDSLIPMVGDSILEQAE